MLLLDYNEVPLDPSLFRNTYTTQALTCTYASVYNVTISEPATDDAVFEDKNVIIADPKSEASVVGNSTYYYSVTFPDGMDTPVSATSARSEITDDGDWNVSREISLLYRPYALGDVDNSGKIDATDTFYLMYYIALRAVDRSRRQRSFRRRATLTRTARWTLPTCSILWCISHTAAQECR